MEPINWSTEWMTSLLWIGEVFAYTLVGFVIIAWLLVHRTGWGRQFWRLSRDFFIPAAQDLPSWRPLLMVALLLLLTVASVRLDVLYSFFTNGLYTALQQLDVDAFWRYFGIFCVIATLSVTLALVAFYVGQKQIIQWWQWLNAHIVDDWLHGAAYHRGRFVDARVDNPDQRIEQDIASFTSISQSLALGAVNAMVTLPAFSIVLWNLSGPLTIFGTEIPRAMVFIAYLYVIVATVIAFRIGKPLIRLSFLREGLRAYYRYGLVRIRDNAENIAFFRGEQAERSGLMNRFGAIVGNYWDIVYRSLKFQGWNLTVSQVSNPFPVLVQAPRFFAQQITLGDVSQTANAFARVEGALSFFRTAYDDFAGYRAVLNRLTGLLDVNDAARALPGPDTEDRAGGLGIRALDITLPDGRPLLTDLDLDLAAGGSLLVKGPSGSGKTTLLRTLAGLWPSATGHVARPGGDDALFLSQQPYVPLGSLRTALAYPASAEELGDDQAREMLRSVQLGHLVDRLDDESDWYTTLSPGEQQRVGFGRVLLRRPSIVFFDEATSALDEGMEHAMYDLVREQLPECTIVSVGHRSTLEALHEGQLQLLGEGRWQASAGVR